MNTVKQVSPQAIVTQIREVVNKTELIFDGIAKIFPEIAREVDSSADKSRKQIHSLESESVSFLEKGPGTSLLGRTRQSIQKASSLFHDLHSRDNLLLTTLREDIQEVKNLDSRIADIRESSEAMELISLNAMTVAVKAGKSGGAFSFITEELKRISARSITYTEELTREGKEIDKTFSTFLASMETVEKMQEELFRNFGTFIDAGFRKAGDATSGAVDFLRQVVMEAQEVKEPLIVIMQQIQHQDIIRQALDHVVLALGELESGGEKTASGTGKEMLDDLAFLKTIPALCSDLIQDVSLRIRESHSVFEAAIADIAGLLNRIENKVREYKSSDSISGYFNEAEKSIKDITANVHHSLEKKNDIISKSQVLTAKVSELQESFTDFSELVGQFQNVNVASKIEIAKQEALASMELTVEEMSNLTRFIDTTVENALKNIRSFFKRTRDSLAMYREIYREGSIFAVSFHNEMTDIAREADIGIKGIEEILENFSAFSQKFVDAYGRSRELLRQLSVCADELNSSTRLLDTVGKEYADRFQEILIESGYGEWNIQSERLQNIIRRFTILEHKKAAGRIGGFEVEEGGEGGEVTFF
jgi:methyl-accepting chemotaxis protein